MKRVEIDHIIRAAADVTGEQEFIIIGSQAILGNTVDDGFPADLLVSMEADMYPSQAPEKAELIDGSLGDGSQFHRTFGYYAHGVGPDTATAPAGWQDRLIEVPIASRAGTSDQSTALFMEMHDIVLSKCVAGRERDWDYAREAMRHDLVTLEGLRAGIPMLPIPEADRRRIETMLEALAAQAAEGAEKDK
jgi:hypothetical protein